MNEASPPLIASSRRKGSGMEYLQRIISGEYAQLPIGITLGFRIAAAVPGSVTVIGNPGVNSYNLLDTVHGGWTAAVLDTAMALSNLTLLDLEQTFTTLDIRINYIRPITVETGEVAAVGSVINSGRRVAYVEAELTDSAGKLLAHGTGSCLILPRTQGTDP
ncbi:MAG TPA: PaaI family thioesterase [Usitatibacter sp.]|nr:PaaI family thioesterase [Usitatibacter sp.]